MILNNWDFLSNITSWHGDIPVINLVQFVEQIDGILNYFLPIIIPEICYITVSYMSLSGISLKIFLVVISDKIQAGDITVINLLVSWQGMNIRTLFWYRPVAQLFMWPELLFTWLLYSLSMAVCSQMTATMWVSWDLITWSGWGNVPRGVITINIVLVTLKL